MWRHPSDLARGGRSQRRSSLLPGAAPGQTRIRADRARSRRGGAATPATAADADLYERLKAWRLGVAREEEVPAYVVFSNSTLALIAGAEPTTEEQLSGISGVGPAKLEKYGPGVLAVVEQHIAGTHEV